MLSSAISSLTGNAPKISKKSVQDLLRNSGSSNRCCSCCPRRHFLGAVLGTGLLPAFPSFASGKDSSPQDPMALLNKIHPPRPDWYEEFYASAMDKTMKSYEAEIAVYKSQLLANLRGKAEKILEIGIGTGPNLKYYADFPGIHVFGVDPNRKMEKYAQAAAETAGLPPSNFRFMQATLVALVSHTRRAQLSKVGSADPCTVAEALPLNDASVDAVIGTLVLCSVKDVDQALQEVRRVLRPGGFYIFVEHVAAKDGTILRFVQGILDPLQQTLADGCHLTRNTATNIARAGFASLDANQIAKTGSLCCVAARPHGSNTTSRDWSVGPHEPYWRTNTSFSPPPSRWDFQFQPEALSFGSHDGIQLYGSSASSNSRESRSWVRGNNLTNHQFLVSDGIGPYLSSPADISPSQQWTPPAIQEISTDDYGTSRRDVVLRPLSFSPTMEGTSAARDSGGSTSSRSDSSCDYESMVKSHSSHRNRRCFMSKAIHPLSFPSETSTRESNGIAPAGMPEFDAITPQRDRHHLSSASGSVDFTEVSEPFEYDLLSRSRSPADCFRCGLCERFLSQRSPWSSRRIVKSGDMPVAGVLSCRHVFHAECLEQTTPKAHKNDPPCPICIKIEEENSPDQRIFSKLRNSFPRLKPFSEDVPSKQWGCVQAGDCVEGALHTPTRNTLLSLNRSRVRKHLSLKGNQGREFLGKLRKSGSFSPQLFIGSVEHGGAGSSKTTGGSSSK